MINNNFSNKPTKEEMTEFYHMLGEVNLKTERKYLLYEEKRILSLYREILKKEYDVTNKSVNQNNELINHFEMQNVIYLIGNLLYEHNYTFTLTSSLKSNDLEHKLIMMDMNKNLIKKYYLEYSNNIYNQDTIRKLGEFYKIQKAKEIEKFAKAISYIINKENGLFLLTNLVFICKRNSSDISFQEVNTKLKELNPIFNNDLLNEYAYNILGNFGLIQTNDYNNGFVKRLSY